MNRDFVKKYVENIPVYFEDKKKDNLRIYNTYNRLLKFLKCPLISKNKKLLDLGSGDGSFVDACKDNSVDAFALDAYSHKIDFELDKIPFESNQFDFITLTSVIEHIKNPKNLLIEIRRVLKKDGHLIITTPNFKYSYKIFFDDPTHVKPYTNTSIVKILNYYGFEVVKTVPFLVNKATWFWKMPFSFFFASILPFKNHDFKNIFFIPKFLRGKSTAMISVAKKIVPDI